MAHADMDSSAHSVDMVEEVQESLPTLLTHGGPLTAATIGKTESAPIQEFMVTEVQKELFADIKQSRFYSQLHCGASMAEKAMELRRRHFQQVGAQVGIDSEGWPTVLPKAMRQPGSDSLLSSKDSMIEIEQFQRSSVFFCGLLGGMLQNVYDAGICCSALFTFASACCTADRADEELLRSATLDDLFFNEIFNKHFGATLLRGPNPQEDTFDVEDAVVCDLQESLSFEVQKGQLYHPCRVFLRQDKRFGLLAEAIVISPAGPLEPEHPEPRVFRKGTSGADEWLWAKRIAVAGAVQRHQYQQHIVNGHMVMETFVALAYRHLSPDHYVFKLLEPVSGDIAFVNQTWGGDLLYGHGGSRYDTCVRCLTPQSIFSNDGLRAQIMWSKEAFEPTSWFWFDKDGYMNGGCGVKESTVFAFRDAIQLIFNATLKWASSVIDVCWQEADEALESWWQALWWKQMEPAKRDLSRDNLAHLMATCIVQATFVHDRAHESWLPDNHSRLLWGLSDRAGDSKDPRAYFPTAARQTSYRLGLMALNSRYSNLESPLLSYRKVFQEERLQQALKLFEDSLARIILVTPYLKSIGSMSH